MRRALLLPAAAIGAGTAALAIAGARERRRIAGEAGALVAGARPVATGRVDEHDLQALPEPVRRWLRHAGVVGTRPPAVVRLQQEGELMLGGRWRPFRAEQSFTVDPPGFLWRAAVRIAPLLEVSGRDRYQGGAGDIRMHLLGAVPVVRAAGEGLDQGAMLRLLAEVCWFPAAALAPWAGWVAAGEDAAVATMRDAGREASMSFSFAPDGRLVEQRALRFNLERGRTEEWVSRVDAERRMAGMLVPAEGEARWEYGEGPLPYIRWRLTGLEYDPPDGAPAR